jgi:hypothetical protein
MNTFFNKYNKYKLKYLYLKGGTIVDEDTSIEVEIPDEHLLRLSEDQEIETAINNIMEILKKSTTYNVLNEYTSANEKYEMKSRKIDQYYGIIRSTVNYNLELVIILEKLLTRLVNICNSGAIYVGTLQIECKIENKLGNLIINDIILIRYLIDLILISKNYRTGKLYRETYEKYYDLLGLNRLPPPQQPQPQLHRQQQRQPQQPQHQQQRQPQQLQHQQQRQPQQPQHQQQRQQHLHNIL